MFEESDAGALLAEVECSRLDESAVWAHRMAAIAPLLWQRTEEALVQALADPDGDPGYALVTGCVRTAAEIGPMLGVPPAVATRLVGYAEALDLRMPQVFGLLASGRLDWESTKVILSRTEFVTDTAIRDVDRNLAAKIATWECWSRTRLLGVIGRAILTLDPDGAKERRATADTQRRISVRALPNGMGEIRVYARAPVVARVDARLAQMAAMVCAADPRTPEQRRVDALDAIGQGSFVLACACGGDDCPAAAAAAATGTADAAAAGARFVINVIAPAATVTGDGDGPGFLQGYGVIDAEQVRDLAAQPATVLREVGDPVCDPHAPVVAGDGTSVLLRHRPSAATDRFVRCRSVTCSFPFCDRPAWTADLDHSIAFDHDHPLRGGWTMSANLDPKCRLHHRLKTFLTGDCGWSTQQLPDGNVTWTSPTGRSYRSTPDGAELFDDLKTAAPRPWRRPRDPRAQKAARTAAARAGAAAKRAANAETRRVNRARAKEIADRKWRNEFRFQLFFFTGKPSTSPFCTWVNDPDEDEHISADWRPPPAPPPTYEDDEPPF